MTYVMFYMPQMEKNPKESVHLISQHKSIISPRNAEVRGEKHLHFA